MDRPRLATVWLGGCSGCHMSFLDLDEFLLELAQMEDLVFSPVLDVKEYPRDVDLCLVEGAICNEQNLEMAHIIRERTRYVISFGDCAVTGNVSALRNQLGLNNSENVLQQVYVENADLNQQIPRENGIVPVLLERVMPLHEAIHVDHYLPGCPPPAGRIKSFLVQLIEGKSPVLTGTDMKFG